MAQIKKTDIIENGVFSNTIENSKELLKLMDALDKEFMKVSSSAKEIKKNIDFSKVSDINKFINLEKQLSTQFDQTTNLMKQRKTVQDQLRQATDEQVKATLRYKQATAEQRKELKLEIELERTQEGSLKRLRLENKKLRNEKENVNRTTKEGARRIKEINTEINRNNAILEKNATQLGKQRMGVGRYSEAIKKNIGRFVGWTAVISAVTRGLRDAAKTVVAFQKAQADLAGVLGKSRKEVRELTRDAKRLGATTIFTASQVSGLQKEFAKLGFSQREILGVTESTLQLATATTTELPRAAEVVGNTLRAFQFDADETQRVVDLMTKSFNESSLDMERFATAMGIVAPVANSAGVSIERTTALLGTLTSAGIDASTAGTGLRNVYLELAKSGLTYEEALEQITNASDKNAKALELFGKRGATIGTVLAENAEKADELEEKLEKAGGTAEKVANEQLDTLDGKLKGLTSAWEGFILSLDEGDNKLGNFFRGLIEAITDSIRGVTLLTQGIDGLQARARAQVWFEGLQENQKEAVKSFKDYVKRVDGLNKDLLKQGLIDQDEYDKRINESLEDRSESYLESYKKRLEQQQKLDKEAGLKFKSTQTRLLESEIVAIQEYIKERQTEELKITEFEAGENKKRLGNHKEYLSRKYELEQEYRRLVRELDNEIVESEKELQIENNERKLKALEEQIENEKELQLAAAEEGREVSLEQLNKLLNEELRLKEENNRLVREMEFRELDLKFVEEEKRIAKNEADRKEDTLRRFEEGKISEEEKNAELVKIYEDYLAALKKLDEKRAVDKERGKQEEIDANKDANKELLEQQDDFNKDLIEAQQKADEEEEKLWEEKNEKRKQALKETVETLNGIAQAFAERQQEIIAKEIENIDALIDKSKQRVNNLRESSNTNRQTIESNIAFEEAKQAQLEKQRLDAEKKQRQIELATTAVEVYSNKVANNDPNPLLNTIKDITLLQQFVKNIPLFWEGTDTTVGAALGTPHLNTARDGYIVRVDKDEKILNPYLSSMTGNMTTEEIAQAAYDKRMGIAQYTNPFDLSNQSISVANVVNNNSTYLLMQEISKQNNRIDETNNKLQELINKPVSSMFLDDTNAIPKIVQKTVEGNKITKQNRMLR